VAYDARVRGAAALLVLPVALLACNPSRNVFQLGVPGSRISLRVVDASHRWAYLDVTLEAEGFRLRTFLPASELCARVAEPGAAVQFRSAGAYGSVVRGEEACDAVGIGSLSEWRDKRSSRGPRLIPSAHATYTTVWSDDSAVFLRGDFPLGRELGFAAMGDAIAVVPTEPICDRAIRSGEATMEFFPGGRNVLTLSGSDGRCPIVGLIRPPAPAPPPEP